MGVMEWRVCDCMSPVQNRSLPQQKIYTKTKQNTKENKKNKKNTKIF